MQLVSLYPFDPTGRASANKIINQSIVVTPPTQITDYSYVVPRGAPFYADSLVVKDGLTVGARTLVENVDYWCVIDFLSASVSLTKRVCVGITLLDPGYSGTLYVTYQAVGGNYSLADYSILEELIRERYVTKHVSYEQLINLPSGFAPDWHAHEIGDMVGMSEVVASLNGVKVSIDGRQGSYGQLNSQISNHVNSPSAHTPSQVGLDNVKNYNVATVADVTAGAGNKYVTANVLKQFVASQFQNIDDLLTATDANIKYATKLELNSYYNAASTDLRYAPKNDTYTKAQVDNLISTTSSTGGSGLYYTKTQSDDKYPNKQDLNDYIKESVADARYATKAEAGAAYTKTQSDSKYALLASNYVTLPVGDGRYMSKADINNYYTKTQSNNARITNSTFLEDTQGADYIMRVVEKLPDSSNVTIDLPLTLSKHVKKSEVYTKTEVDAAIADAATKYKRSTFTSPVNWPGYPNFMLKWVVTRVDKIFYITCTNVAAFYYQEASYLASMLPAGDVLADHGTSGRPLSTFAELGSASIQMDGWARILSSTFKWKPTTGDITWTVTINQEDTGGERYIAPESFFTGITVLADSPAMLAALNNLLTRGTVENI